MVPQNEGKDSQQGIWGMVIITPQPSLSITAHEMSEAKGGQAWTPLYPESVLINIRFSLAIHHSLDAVNSPFKSTKNATNKPQTASLHLYFYSFQASVMFRVQGLKHKCRKMSLLCCSRHSLQLQALFLFTSNQRK